MCRAAELYASDLPNGEQPAVIDMIVIVSIHGLLALAGYRLMLRDDLDEDPLLEEPDGKGTGGPGRGAP